LFTPDVFEEEAELVTAEAGDGVAAAQLPLQARCQADQQLVTDRVAEAVVDPLGLVQVEQHHRNLCSGACRSGQRLSQSIVEQRPVRKPRKRIMHGVVQKPLLKCMPLRGIASDRFDSQSSAVLVDQATGHLDER
jgi:hypothetical protein